MKRMDTVKVERGYGEGTILELLTGNTITA
jgi:hypothetical protein